MSSLAIVRVQVERRISSEWDLPDELFIGIAQVNGDESNPSILDQDIGPP